MKLYVMRHGPAEDESASGRDFDRALTPSGRDRVRHVARTLVELDEAPREIVSSPLVRALQTAEIVAAATELSHRGERVSARRELAPGGPVERLVSELAADAHRRVLITGHEPDLSQFVAEVSGHVLPAGLEKGMIVALSIEPGTSPPRGKVRFVVHPKSLDVVRPHGA